MRQLILVKHARPKVVAEIPSHDWELSDEGRSACLRLAERIRPYDPAVIVTSDEPKAHQTGQIVAGVLSKPVEMMAGLQEHDRRNVPMMAPPQFISTMALFLKHRDRPVLGRETAEEAASRFRTALDAVLNAHPQGNLVVVTHGTVLALFASENGAGDAFLLWRRLGLPSLMTFAAPGYRLLEEIDSV